MHWKKTLSQAAHWDFEEIAINTLGCMGGLGLVAIVGVPLIAFMAAVALVEGGFLLLIHYRPNIFF